MSRIKVKELVKYGFAVISIIGFVLMLGTVGGMTQDTIEFGAGCVRCVIGLAMWIGGLLVYDN